MLKLFVFYVFPRCARRIVDELQRLLDKKISSLCLCVCVCVCVCELPSKIAVFEYTNFIFHTACNSVASSSQRLSEE